jgi:hypothetical protein
MGKIFRLSFNPALAPRMQEVGFPGDERSPILPKNPTPIASAGAAPVKIGSAQRHPDSLWLPNVSSAAAHPTAGSARHGCSADDDPRNRFARERLQAPRPALDMDHEERHRGGLRRPEPALSAGLLPTGLVGVLHRRPSHGIACLVVRTGQRGGGLLFQGDDRTQRHRDVVAATRGPMTWVRTSSGIVARLTMPHPGQMRMGLMLGDDRGQLGEFGDLVPGGAQRRRDRVRWAKASGRPHSSRADG